MSSMTRTPFLVFALLATTSIAPPAMAQETGAWDNARASMVASQPNQVTRAINRWEYLTAANTREAGFDAYAGFVLAYPDFPKAALLRARAEKALDSEPVDAARMVAFFDKHPPLSNSARARYALALASLGRSDAFAVARDAWRGGSMASTSEAYMVGLFGARFQPEDYDARMNALLWQGDTAAAVRIVNNVSPANMGIYQARLALTGGTLPASAGVSTPADAMTDPGYVYNLAQHHLRSGNMPAAISLLANRPQFAGLPHLAEDYVALSLQAAKGASSGQAVQIASKVDDLFAPGTDISAGSFRLRDTFTDLMWLGGTSALWNLGDGRSAAPLFYRYGTSARTPLTRSKGFFWAGRAAARAGDRAEAERYWNLAAEHPDYYYGQLALAELGQPMPAFADIPINLPSAAEKAAFDIDPLTIAIRELARNRKDWRTERAFFSAISDKADTPAKMALVAQLARETGLDEMAVVAGMTAGEHGFKGFERLGFPTVAPHPGANWTMVHAIARQESEFDRNRVSHAGARGMMQLMPGTAREEAGKVGINYLHADLTANPAYNIRLGDAHFARLMDRYGGAYPLAIAAYNAGPGRVNEWLRLNGDPRYGGIGWAEWIEKIPANFETRYYVMRVIGNAVTYANMHPDRSAPYQRDVRHYLPR
ncbi:MAG: lytic transglycosylase domain-containing protein [Erythrobacter sp.]|nr:lytic transglycosylase domain-containing protein [Erythrobacter sp.]